MKFAPHPFQKAAIDFCVDWVRSASRSDKKLLTSPTGTGKSVMELGIQEQLDWCWIITPREEIVWSYLDKLQVPEDEWSFDEAFRRQICTPIRMRNAMLHGEVDPPKSLIIDEAHHATAETWQQLDLLSGCCPALGFTATGFRGSPKGTRALLDQWGEPEPILTYSEALGAGYISMPKFTMLPLVDDDTIEISGGEFTVVSVESAYKDRISDLANASKKWYNGKWDKATLYSMPGSATCELFQRAMARENLPVLIVNASTSREDRRIAFDACVERIAAIVHVNIISEGVDLPIRRLVDCAPTMSPVRWLQQLGRATRPAPEGDLPEYVCSNRNILRHAYVLSGCLPPAVASEAERAFGPSDRDCTRAVGLEAIGRFKPTRAKLLSGTSLTVYSLSQVVDNGVVDFCCVIHPLLEPVWAVKVNTKNEDGTRNWGKWARCGAPQDLRGFSSIGPKAVSEKQINWWKRSAAVFGLDPTVEPDRKNFQVLPVLNDLNLRLK